jgi:hypothetical protein
MLDPTIQRIIANLPWFGDTTGLVKSVMVICPNVYKKSMLSASFQIQEVTSTIQQRRCFETKKMRMKKCF